MNKNIFTLILFLVSSSLFAQQTEIFYLSGTEYGKTVKWDFRCSDGRNSRSWKKIEVPSCWEQQGFGAYTYGRYYKYEGRKASEETGSYHHTFTVPQSWKNKQIEIVFEGVMTDATVKINNQLAGSTHQGGFLRFSYDVTDKLQYGKKNRLDVFVAKQSANPSVNKAERRADWWLFGGIYRPVYLRIKPQTHIDKLAVDAGADGTLRTDLYMKHLEEGMSVAFTLQSIASQAIIGKTICKLTSADKQSFTTQWTDIKTWDPEHPNLYKLNVQLLGANGQVVHEETERIGFRTIKFLRHDGIYLNGTKIIAKGTNRHTFWPESGRTINRSIALNDAKLIKQMNMNAIRSHYPPDTYFLDICDSLGILYINELPGWQLSYDDSTAKKLVAEMIQRDVNHPCIYLWSNGNEGGWNTSIDNEFAKLDIQKRHVIHPWANFNGIDTQHYPGYYNGPYRLANGNDVFMPTEFLHGLYDRGQAAGLNDYWKLYMQNPLFAGGFLWAFLDEAVCRTDKNGQLDSYGPNGPDGIVGPHREKEGSFFTVREIWSPIQIEKFVINESFKGDFLVTNQFLFSKLNEAKMNWRLLKATTPLEGGNLTGIAQGSVTLPNLTSHETGYAHFDLPTNFPEGDILEMEAYNSKGDTICTWSYPVKKAEQYAKTHKIYNSTSAIPAKSYTSGNIIVLEANGIKAQFDKNTSLLKTLTRGSDTLPLSNGPQLVGMKMKLQNASTYQQGDTAVYVAHYTGAVDSIVWRMAPNGTLGMDALILNSRNGKGFEGAFVDKPIYQLGFSFDYPEKEVKGIKWMGDGPYRVWRNRLKGANLGIWQKDYNNTVTGEYYNPLVYPEFKGYHAHIYWATLENDQHPMTVYTENDGLYLRLFTPEESRDNEQRGQQFITFPSGDISFLLEIPGMRCGSLLPDLGPESHPTYVKINIGDEGYHIRLWFKY